MEKDIVQDTGQENSKQDKIYWHDGFYAALQLEFHDYAQAAMQAI